MSILSFPNRLFTFLAAAAMLAMTAIGTADILARLANKPVAGSYELIETLMVFVVFLGIAKAEEQNRHVSVTLFVNFFPSALQIVLRSFGSLVSALLFCLIAYFGWAEAVRSLSTGEVQAGEIAFPLWPARLVLALGASMMVFQCLRKIFGDIRELSSRFA